MTLVWLAIVAISIVTILNLILIVGIVRRLREHTDKLAGLQLGDIQIAAREGDTVSYELATDTTGTVIGPDLFAFAQWTFFSEDCPACKEGILDYVKEARARGPEIAVIVGTGKAADDMAAQVSAVGVTTTREAMGGSLQKAFSVAGFPAFVDLDNGVVQHSGFRRNS